MVLGDLQLIIDVDLAVGDRAGGELQNTVNAQADASDPERRQPPPESYNLQSLVECHYVDGKPHTKSMNTG